MIDSIPVNERFRKLTNPGSNFLAGLVFADDVLGQTCLAGCSVRCPDTREGASLIDLPPIHVSGNGKTRSDACERLFMEAAERHSSVFVGSENFERFASLNEQGFQLSSLLHFSSTQYAQRIETTPMDSPWWVPERLTADIKIRWKATRSILTNQQVFIPAAFVYLGYGFDDEPLYHLADSTGCAAGDTLDDATYRGLLEIIERDAVGIWWYNRVSRPGFDLDCDPLLGCILRELQFIGRDLHLIDITHDLGIPVVVALSSDSSGGRLYLGSAADLCPKRAAIKATREMLQFWFWGQISDDPTDRARWLRTERLGSQPWLRPTSRKAFPPTPPNRSAAEMLAALVSQISKSGFDSLVIELSRPWLGIPVVRTLVPGLRNHKPQFGPGRLFELPKQLGWNKDVTCESDLFDFACPI